VFARRSKPMIRVFGSTVKKIDFGRIDFEELILIKSEVNVK